MEDYLKIDYDVWEDEKWLKSEEDIKSYFSEDVSDLFDCGQGYAQDEADVICKIGDKFYEVNIRAEIGSQWMDRGDRVYYVQSIESVTYQEIDKPKPKERDTLAYEFTLTKSEKDVLEDFLKGNGISYYKMTDGEIFNSRASINSN